MDVPVADDDEWPDHPMHVRRTVTDNSKGARAGADSNGSGNGPSWTTATPRPTGGTRSQLYGSSKEKQARLRTLEDGKLTIGADGRLPDDPDQPGVDLAGFNENLWFGLSCLHTLFTKEHNAICDVLKKENPRWDDQRLFDTAWLINSALMAKIHTVEWTPGIVNTPALWAGDEHQLVGLPRPARSRTASAAWATRRSSAASWARPRSTTARASRSPRSSSRSTGCTR